MHLCAHALVLPAASTQHTDTISSAQRTRKERVVAATVQVWEAKMTHIDPAINSDKYYDLQLLIGQYENPPIPTHSAPSMHVFSAPISVGRCCSAAFRRFR